MTLAAPRRLVVDANVYIAAFLRDSTVRRILTASFLELFVPEFLFEEIDRHLPDLMARTSFGAREAGKLRRRMEAYLTVVPATAVRSQIRAARRIMEPIDRRDSPYVAAALALDCDGIWSDDLHLKRQSAVPCWTTKQLVSVLRADGLRL